MKVSSAPKPTSIYTTAASTYLLLTYFFIVQTSLDLINIMAPTPISKFFQSKPSSSGFKSKASSSIAIEKKQQKRLSVAEKLQLLKKYEAGASVKSLCEEYGPLTRLATLLLSALLGVFHLR